MNIEINHNNVSRTLDIQRSEITSWRIAAKFCCAIASVVLGLVLWHVTWTDQSEIGSLPGFLAVLCFVAAVALPYHKHTYLNFTDRDIVNVTHYGWFQRRACRPLAEFSRIVVRHVCHPGGEGPDTYTGSVGLKAADGRAAFWVREFPTSEDEAPRAAYEFASALQVATGLPLDPSVISSSPALLSLTNSN